MPPRRRSTTSTRRKSAKTAPQRSPSQACNPGEHAWLIDVPYDDRYAARSAGARWWPGYGWVYIGTEVPDALKQWLPIQYSWAAFVQRHLLDGDKTSGNPTPDNSTGGFTLRPDQDEDVAAVATARDSGAPEFLLGSLVGTGKTLVAVAAVKRMRDVRRVLVVCPLGVMPGWRNTLQVMGDGGKEWVFINYQSTKTLLHPPASAAAAKKTATRNKRIAAQGVPKVPWDVVITDESHALADTSTQQFKVMDRVIEGPAGSPAFSLRMSATAGSNPSQLAYLHRGLMWRTGNDPGATIDAEKFVTWAHEHGIHVDLSRYGKDVLWQPKTNPDDFGQFAETDLAKVRSLLFGGAPRWAVRRVPDWPEQQRILTPVDLTPAEWQAYDAEWKSYKATADEIVQAAARNAAASPQSSAERKQASKEAATLRMRGQSAKIRYRQKAGLLRAPHTADFINTMIDKGMQVGVSCEYLATVEALRVHLENKGIHVATFTGENRESREDQRVAFQRGECPVILYTPVEGFNLHAGETAVSGNDVPRIGVVAEPRWSPRRALQAEGRQQRDGRSAPCYYLYAAGTAEERVLQVVVPGMAGTLAMMGDNVEPLAALCTAMGMPSAFASFL